MTEDAPKALDTLEQKIERFITKCRFIGIPDEEIAEMLEMLAELAEERKL